MKVSDLSARIGDEAARNIEGTLSTLGAKEIAAYAVEDDDGWVTYVATDLGLGVCPWESAHSAPRARARARPAQAVPGSRHIRHYARACSPRPPSSSNAGPSVEIYATLWGIPAGLR